MQMCRIKIVDICSRAGDSQISQSVLVSSYLAATGGALATALGLNAAVKGPYLYDVRSGWGGGGGSPKSRQKEQNQLISVCDKGEGVQKYDSFADVIYGSPLVCRRHRNEPMRSLCMYNTGM